MMRVLCVLALCLLFVFPSVLCTRVRVSVDVAAPSHASHHHQHSEEELAQINEADEFDDAAAELTPARVQEYTGPAVVAESALQTNLPPIVSSHAPAVVSRVVSVSAGMDTSGFPGVSKMAALKKSTNFKFTAFYLGPAPSHPGADWMPHRADLVSQGWGFAPVFVGRQTTGPGSHSVSNANGVLDGKTTAALMKQAGFPAQSYAYLDLEEGAPLSNAHRDYVVAWSNSLKEQGYNPGVYCSYLIAPKVAAAVPEARIWAFHVKTTSSHRVSGTAFSTSPPSGSKFAKAFIWQYDDNAKISNGMTVDLNTALSDDPSRP